MSRERQVRETNHVLMIRLCGMMVIGMSFLPSFVFVLFQKEPLIACATPNPRVSGQIALMPLTSFKLTVSWALVS